MMQRSTMQAERERAQAEILIMNYRAIGPAAILASLKGAKPKSAGDKTADVKEAA